MKEHPYNQRQKQGALFMSNHATLDTLTEEKREILMSGCLIKHYKNDDACLHQDLMQHIPERKCGLAMIAARGE